jgi:hypothetical protein
MPRYECPRCGSDRAFFQSEKDLQNGLEMYTDINGKTHFRNNLRVNSVQTPYCHDCIVVKMNSYRTAEEIKSRNQSIFATVIFGLVVLCIFFFTNRTSDGASNFEQNKIQENWNDSTFDPEVTPGFYTSEIDSDGSQLVNRDLVSTGKGNCGSMLYDLVQETNEIVPEDWLLAEFNGCGSGSSYRWFDETDLSKYVELEFHADAGWCVDLLPTKRTDAVGQRILDEGESLVQISVVEESATSQFIYIKSSSTLASNIIGVIEVGTDSEFCGRGDTSLESPIGEFNDLYTELASRLFGG